MVSVTYGLKGIDEIIGYNKPPVFRFEMPPIC